AQAGLFADRGLLDRSGFAATSASTSSLGTLVSLIRSSAGSSSFAIASSSRNQCSFLTRSIRLSLTTKLLNKHRQPRRSKKLIWPERSASSGTKSSGCEMKSGHAKRHGKQRHRLGRRRKRRR